MSITADPATLASFWTRARAMLARVSDEIGAVETLAALTSLGRARHYLIAGCIALIETIVRKLLFAEAALRLRADTGVSQPPRGPCVEFVPLRQGASVTPSGARATHSVPEAFDAVRPEAWRVRFNLKPPRDPSACPESRAPRVRALWGESIQIASQSALLSAPRHVTPAPLRLAMRLEAVRRVLANPAPHVKRLTRLLPRLCGRYPDAALRYATAAARPHRSDEGDPRLIIETMALALTIAPIFSNSS